MERTVTLEETEVITEDTLERLMDKKNFSFGTKPPMEKQKFSYLVTAVEDFEKEMK
mgnify:CR=1 FL=1